MLSIEIPRRNSCCAKGLEKLEPGMEVYSALWDDQEGDRRFIRHDYCESCWPSVTQQETFAKVRSFWKSKIPTKKEESPLPKQRDERALHLLKAALGSDNIDDQTQAFILALYLARKRRLVFRKELLQDSKTLLLYEVAATEEILCIPKFALSLLNTEKIQLELAHKFKQ